MLNRTTVTANTRLSCWVRYSSEPPFVDLDESHIRNCELLVDRQQLLSKLKKHGVVAEVGVAAGTFTERIINAAEPEKLHLIDVWGTSRYRNSFKDAIEAKYQDRIANQSVVVHQAMSVAAASQFKDQYFDWIYIDTDHTYDTTKKVVAVR